MCVCVYVSAGADTFVEQNQVRLFCVCSFCFQFGQIMQLCLTEIACTLFTLSGNLEFESEAVS